MKLIFCLQINIKGFFKLIPSHCMWSDMPTLPKITSAISLQYLKKVNDEFDFLQADKSEAKTRHFEIGKKG